MAVKLLLLIKILNFDSRAPYKCSKMHMRRLVLIKQLLRGTVGKTI